MKIKRGAKYQGKKPCKRGHDGLRYVRDGVCVQCACEAAKRQKLERQREAEAQGPELNSTLPEST